MSSEPETPYVLTTESTDGQRDVSAYSTYKRATWNFTEVILKDSTKRARITIDGGAKQLAEWNRTEAASGL